MCQCNDWRVLILNQAARHNISSVQELWMEWSIIWWVFENDGRAAIYTDSGGWNFSVCLSPRITDAIPVKIMNISVRKIPLTCSSISPVPRFLQLYWRGYLEDSRSFNGDPPHLTLNHGFPVIWLSRPKVPVLSSVAKSWYLINEYWLQLIDW